jgi:hypothetical protein
MVAKKIRTVNYYQEKIDFSITKAETIIMASFVMLGIIWLVFVIPILMTSRWFYTMTPLLAFPLYNIGVIFLITGLFGIVFSMLRFKESFVRSFQYGFAAWIGHALFLDIILTTPYYLAYDNTVVVPLGTPALMNASGDAFIAEIFKILLGDAVFSMVSVFHIIAVFILFGTCLILVEMFTKSKKKDSFDRNLEYAGLAATIIIAMIFIALGYIIPNNELGLWFILTMGIAPLSALFLLILVAAPDTVMSMFGDMEKKKSRRRKYEI